jgi:two-component system, NtrC family, response regulator HydG
MLIMTVSTYRIASHYLNRAYARNAHTRALAQAHEIQQILVEARYEILNLGHADLTAESIQAYMMGKPATKRNRYAEIAFHAVDPDKNFLLDEHRGTPLEGAKRQGFRNQVRDIHQKGEIEGKLEDFVQIDPARAGLLHVGAISGFRGEHGIFGHPPEHAGHGPRQDIHGLPDAVPGHCRNPDAS